MEELEKLLEVAVHNYTQLGGVVPTDQKKEHQSANKNWYEKPSSLTCT